MTDELRCLALREFFTTPYPYLHPRTLVVGGCVAFLGVLSTFSDGGGGMVLLGLGVLYALVLPLRIRSKPGEDANEAQLVSLLRYPGARERYRCRASEEDVMSWLMKAVLQIQDESKDRLGLEETTREPICVVGPLYSERVDGVVPELVLRRRGANGYIYSTYRISVFHFSDTLLGAYQCTFNLVQHRAIAEEMAEFFYQDVVAVRTLTEPSSQVLKSGEKLSQARTFSLTSASGDRIRIVIDDPAIRVGDQLRSLCDEAANNIRAMLRQYKAPLREAL